MPKPYKGKIIVELEIEADEDGHWWEHKVTVTGIPKDELYSLFEDDLIQINDAVYDHMSEMED